VVAQALDEGRWPSDLFISGKTHGCPTAESLEWSCGDAAA